MAKSLSSEIEIFRQNVEGAYRHWQKNTPSDSEVRTAVQTWQRQFKRLKDEYPKFAELLNEKIGAEMSLGNSANSPAWMFAMQLANGLRDLTRYTLGGKSANMKADRTPVSDLATWMRSISAAQLRWQRMGNMATWSKEVQPQLKSWRQTWDGLKARYPKLKQLDAHFVDEALNGWRPTDDPLQGVRGLKQALSTVIGQADSLGA